MFEEFFGEIKQGVRGFDLLLMLSVPAVLSIVFLLPGTIQAGFVLDYSDPSIFNLWSSAFVHRGFGHFSSNLVSYSLLIVPIYLFFVLAKEHSLFRRIFYTFIFALPFVISLINLATINPKTGAGFSGVGSAFFGLLPVSVFLFIQNRVSKEIEPSHAVVLFLVAAANIALIYTGASALTASVSLLVVLLLAYDVHQIGLDNLKAVYTELQASPGQFELVVFSLLLFLGSPKMLFPSEIAQNGMTVNILSHYLGLALGFFIPYTYLIYRSQSESDQNFTSLLNS